MAGAISMCTYRVIHRLHHNNLYTDEDPDTAIHGGYPRGTAYLWKKLGQDAIGWNAWKTFAYFFGAPALTTSARAADDTRRNCAAAVDRWFVVLPARAASLAAGAAWPVRVLAAADAHRAAADPAPARDLRARRGDDFSRADAARQPDRGRREPGRGLLFPHHVNYHLEHHLYPAVPHYHLPRLHRLLAEKGALDGAEVRDLGATLARLRAPRRSASKLA